MTTPTGPADAARGLPGEASDTGDPPVRTTGPGAFAVLLAVTFLAFVDYAALLSVVPLWSAAGGANGVAVGATTGVMMAATVAAQLAAPWLFRMLALRTMIVGGAVLLGAPTPLYLLSADIGPVLVITVVRGIGLALVVIAGATLVADLSTPRQLSSRASLFGVAAALPNLGALAGGVWIARTWGFPIVFWGSTLACLTGAALAVLLPRGHRATFRFATTAEAGNIAAPIALFALTAGSFGAVTTFLPVALPDAGAASWALLSASIALVAARLGAGPAGGRLGAGHLLLVSVLCCAAGSVLTAVALATGHHVLLFGGTTLLGAGFGACQNDSFVLTVQRLGPARSATASTLWNIAYDGGLGLGATTLGWFVGTTGYSGAFLGMGIVIGVVSATVAVIGRFRGRGPGRGESAPAGKRPEQIHTVTG
ncbi:MFS transporter [Nocardia jinanensis]|uniref:MFS transporter n=1 Tax=Nocardia jinanensis TaxID=382504 RepID=A0A917RRH5_9NOCA|nr:MFS transporter [Nocardia jinanensis]GGL21006.1 MFS transporter [Nocardia jinanensis]